MPGPFKGVNLPTCKYLMQVYSAEPILGVQFTVEDAARPLKEMTIARK